MNDAGRARLLVITLSNIGDLVLTTPVLETLAARYPDSRIDVVGDARSIELLAAAPWAGTLYCRDKRAGVVAQLALLRTLRRTRYRAIADLRTPLLPWLLRAKRRLIKHGPAPAGMHAAADHFRVLAPLQAVDTPPWCKLHLARDAQAEADERLRTLPGRRWLALAPGANWPGKRWPIEHYRALLDLARDDFDAAIVIGSAGDAEASTTLGQAALPLLFAVGDTRLPVAAALIARAALFAGNDSGPGHIAAALGVPTLTMFGPGNPQRYRPWGPYTALALAPGGVLTELTPAAAYAALTALAAQAAAR